MAKPYEFPETVMVEVGPGRFRSIDKARLDLAYFDEVQGERWKFYRAKAEDAIPAVACDEKVNRNDLGLEDRRSLSRLIGVPIHDMAQAKKEMAEKGLRFIEKGERNSKARREAREWCAEPADKRGPMPEILEQRRNVPKLDIHEVYRRVREKRRGAGY